MSGTWWSLEVATILWIFFMIPRDLSLLSKNDDSLLIVLWLIVVWTCKHERKSRLSIDDDHGKTDVEEEQRVYYEHFGILPVQLHQK